MSTSWTASMVLLNSWPSNSCCFLWIVCSARCLNEDCSSSRIRSYVKHNKEALPWFNRIIMIKVGASVAGKLGFPWGSTPGQPGEWWGKQRGGLVSLPMGTLFKLQKKFKGEFKILWSLLTVARDKLSQIRRSFFNQMNPSYIRKISGGRGFIEKHLNQENFPYP